MFRLHETTRRRICVVAFFLLCIVPTVAVSAWCVWRQMPRRVAMEAQRLSGVLGLDVSLDGLSHPRPGIALYEEFGLADAETGQIALRCPALKAAWQETTDAQGNHKRSLVLAASQPQLQAATIEHLGRLLGRTLRSRAGRPQVGIRLSAAEATLRTDGTWQTLTNLQGSIESLPHGARAQVVFHLAGVDAPEPIVVRVDRNRQTIPPTTAFEMSTGGAAVPCGLLALGPELLGMLGSQGLFRGSLWARQTPDGWDGELAGELLEVDLGRLLGDRFSNQLTGAARVTINSARFRGGRLLQASGTVVASRGTVGRSLIDAAVDRLKLVPVVKPSPEQHPVPYGQMALAFSIDSRGLQLQGLCTGTGRGAIMVDGYTCLLAEPRSQPQPLIELLRAWVPAGRRADWLMRWLPVPQPAAAEVGPPATLRR